MFAWLKKWFGEGTEDDRRNCGWRITERLRVPVEWHCSLLDIRIGFKRNGRWMWQCQGGAPVEQNFWNGILTLQLYVIKTSIKRFPIIIPRIGLVSRFARDYWLQAGIGYLFDRGEFGAKLTIQNCEKQEKWNPGCNAQGWDEGPV